MVRLATEDLRGRFVSPTKTWARRDLAEVRGLVVHQSAGSDNVAATAHYHMSPGVHIGDGTGLPGLAYTWFVPKDGRLLLCNELESVTWSQGDKTQPGDENRLYMSVCFGGAFKAPGWTGAEEPTPAQVTTLHLFWAGVKAALGLQDYDLYGHYCFGKPTCPGTALEAVVEAYNAKVPHVFDAHAQQRALSLLGDYKGVVDGVVGPKTRGAIASFEHRRRLPVTGLWSRLVAAEVLRLGLTPSSA